MYKKIFPVFVLGMTLSAWADETQQVQPIMENQIQAVEQNTDNVIKSNNQDVEFVENSNQSNEKIPIDNQETETLQATQPTVANKVLSQQKKRKKYDLLSAYEAPIYSKEDFDKAREFVKREKERMRMVQPVFLSAPIKLQTD